MKNKELIEILQKNKDDSEVNILAYGIISPLISVAVVQDLFGEEIIESIYFVGDDK